MLTGENLCSLRGTVFASSVISGGPHREGRGISAKSLLHATTPVGVVRGKEPALPSAHQTVH